MGIRGMERFTENAGNISYRVNVIELIHDYRRTYNRTPVIVIDAKSILGFLYKLKNLPWIYGGQMKEYFDVVLEFINTLCNEGAELVFFFDGPTVNLKIETWVKRRMDNVKNIYKLLDALESGEHISQHDRDTWFWILPANLGQLTAYVAKKCGCKVFSSVRECDFEIAEYAAVNNCMAILGQDSDFIIFDSAMYYLSMKNFNFQNFTTLNYDRKRLASHLNIRVDQLPLLATLLGNDVIPFDSLKTFHSSLLRRCNDIEKRRFSFFYNLFHKASDIVRSTPSGSFNDPVTLNEIAERVYFDRSKSTLIQESIKSYVLAVDSNKDRGCPRSRDENWNKILEKLHALHNSHDMPSTIYNIMVQQSYNCSAFLEDYRKTDLPACQNVLKKLRQKLYGILLYEKPGDAEVEDGVVISESDEVEVQEFVVCGDNSLDEAVYVKAERPTVPHPGLLALWSGQNPEDSWRLLGYIYQVNPKDIKALPPHLIVPALTIRYLNENMTIENWELNAIICSMVLVEMYNAQYLSKIKVSDTVRDTRPIRLYTIVSNSYSTAVLIIHGLCCPISSEMYQCIKYQDGKLFHLKYCEARNEDNVFSLCDKKEGSYKHFKEVSNFIFKQDD